MFNILSKQIDKDFKKVKERIKNKNKGYTKK